MTNNKYFDSIYSDYGKDVPIYSSFFQTKIVQKMYINLSKHEYVPHTRYKDRTNFQVLCEAINIICTNNQLVKQKFYLVMPIHTIGIMFKRKNIDIRKYLTIDEWYRLEFVKKNKYIFDITTFSKK